MSFKAQLKAASAEWQRETLSPGPRLPDLNYPHLAAIEHPAVRIRWIGVVWGVWAGRYVSILSGLESSLRQGTQYTCGTGYTSADSQNNWNEA